MSGVTAREAVFVPGVDVLRDEEAETQRSGGLAKVPGPGPPCYSPLESHRDFLF